jgi:exoribonuclease R
MNRAIHGDIVAVEIFPESEWKAPADTVVDQDGVGFGSFSSVKLKFLQPP